MTPAAFSRSLGARAALAQAALSALAAALIVVLAVGGGGVSAGYGVALAAVLAVGASSVWLTLRTARRARRISRTATDAALSVADGEPPDSARFSGFGGLDGTDARELADAFERLSRTVRRRSDDLALERRLLEAVMETMSEGVVVVDSESAVRMINQSAQRLLGTDSGARGRSLAEITRDFNALQIVSRSAETRQMQRAQIELMRPRRFLTVTATPLSGGVGEGGVLLTLRDATDERRAQTTRREFVSNVSHELRSPLASIRAMVETLENGALDDRETARDFLARIQGDIGRMTALVDELLELSSLESGQMPLHLSPVDLREAAGAIVERFRLAAAAQGIELKREVGEDAPHAMADPAKLDQILTNLLENALRFTPRGGRIAISARARPRWVDVRVSDTGAGISKEHLPRVFERFFKADRSRRDGGTGLGLAIAKHLAQAHGGEMRAESAEGEGSVFTVTLRRAT